MAKVKVSELIGYKRMVVVNKLCSGCGIGNEGVPRKMAQVGSRWYGPCCVKLA